MWQVVGDLLEDANHMKRFESTLNRAGRVPPKSYVQHGGQPCHLSPRKRSIGMEPW